MDAHDALQRRADELYAADTASHPDIEVVARLFSVVDAHDKALIDEAEAKDQVWQLALAEVEAREAQERRMCAEGRA